MERVPATVITGFLGAGKTSLVRHLLGNAGGRRLAVLVNEFGELGIDRELLSGCGDIACREDDIVELANGCICCTVAEDFLPNLARLLDRPHPPEHILIETSGLALPKPLVQAFAWPEIRARTTVDAVLAVIDAGAAASGEFAPAEAGASHDNPVEEVFADQLAAADIAILNKSDLVASERLARLRRDIEAELRPGVRLLLAREGRVPASIVLGLAAAAEDDLAARPARHDAEGEHDHDDFESFVLELGPIADERTLLMRLAAVIRAHRVLRVKGFLYRPGRERRLAVQAVGDRLQHYFDRPWRTGELPASRLVVIGLKGLDRQAIAAGLAL